MALSAPYPVSAPSQSVVLDRAVSIPWYVWSSAIAVTSTTVGLYWDISWHTSIGRDMQRCAGVARGKDETNAPKAESKPAVFQNAAESIHRHPGFGRNHGGRVATRSSHSCQWRRRCRKDTVRTGVPGSGRYPLQRTRPVHVVRGIDPGPDQECRFAGFRPGPPRGGQETVRGPRVHHAKR